MCVYFATGDVSPKRHDPPSTNFAKRARCARRIFKECTFFSLGTDPHVHDNIEHLEIETWKDHNLTRADLGWETTAVRVCGSALVFDCRKA